MATSRLGGHVLYYLASPYSHPDLEVRQRRYRQATSCVANLLGRGVLAVSPIVHSHPVAVLGNLETSWEAWKVLDSVLLLRCDRVLVLMVDGWMESVGVAAEVALAREASKDVWYATEDGAVWKDLEFTEEVD